MVKNGDLVVIPRREYEDLLRVKKQRTSKGHKKESKEFRDPELDRELDKAIKEYEEGKYYGPFRTIEELRASLEK